MPIYSLKTGEKSRSLLVGNAAYVPPAPRAVFAGGANVSGVLTKIQYVETTTTGNATNFGDMVVGRNGARQGGASSTRGIFSGGGKTSNVKAD